MTKPLLILVGGLSGSGKSTLAEGLVKTMPGSVFIDSDRLRKEMFGVPATQKLPPEAYASAVSQKLYAEMFARAERGIAEGRNVIISATFTFATSQQEYEDLAAKRGAGFQGIWLKTDTNVLFGRVAARKNDASDADISIVELQAKSAINIPTQKSWATIDAGQTAAQVLQQACVLIRNNPGRKPSAGQTPPSA